MDGSPAIMTCSPRFWICNPLEITVLFGGPSSEREVSLKSGRAVAQALSDCNHKVYQADIGPENLVALERPADVIFPVLHGSFGEDGQLQAIMEARGLRFAGCDARSSRLAMDKYASKQAFLRDGITTATSVLIKASNPRGQAPAGLETTIKEAIETCSLPLVIKPNAEGSSIGVVIARDEASAESAINDVIKSYGDCLVEKFIPGREFTVGILGETPLPVLEVKPAGGFYDYHAKYIANTTEYLFDFDLEPGAVESLQEDALAAFKSLGCRDFGRIDVIRTAAGRNYILEINTIPGFTDHSLLPKAAARAGLSFAELCDRIVRMTLDRPI